MTTFEMAEDGYVEVRFSLETEETALTRFIDPMPFVPGNEADRIRRCDEILAIQAAGLKKRLEHTHCKTAVVGISGGLIPRWHCLSPCVRSICSASRTTGSRQSRCRASGRRTGPMTTRCP